MSIGYIAPKSITKDDFFFLLGNDDVNSKTDVYHLSASGSFEDFTTTDKMYDVFNCHYHSLDDVYLLKTYSFLLNNDFSINFLKTVISLVRNQQLFLEMRPDRPGQLSTNATILNKHGFDCKVQGPFLVLRLSATSTPSGPSICGELIKQQASFFKMFNRYSSALADDFPCKKEKRSMAVKKEAALRYSLFGANQKSHLVSSIVKQQLPFTPLSDLSLLDVGGGFGFLGAELALKGMNVTVMDYDSQKEIIFNWLSRIIKHKGRLDFTTSGMEQFEFDKSYDMISFFGSLLYCPRSNITTHLKNYWDNLNDGGLLIVHENPKGIGDPASLDYHLRFEFDELHQLLSDFSDIVYYYHPNSASHISPEQARKTTNVAVIKKNS